MTTCSTGSPRGYSATRNNSSTQLNSQKDTAVSRTVSAGSSVAVRSAALGAGHAARAGSGRAAQEELAKLREQYAKLEAKARSSASVLQASVRQARHVLLGLKQQHKELLAQLTAASSSSAAKGKPPIETLIEQRERDVHDLRRQHDRIMQDKRTVVAKLQNLQESLQRLQPPASGGDGGSGGGQPEGAMGWLGVAGNEARAMRMLENRLDKALLKANEARSVGHMYEEVLERMRGEALLFDPRSKALEEGLAARRAALLAAQNELRAVQRARDAAKQELIALEERVAAERAARAASIQAGRAAVLTLSETNQALLARQFGGIAGSQQQQEEGHARRITSPRAAVAALCAAHGCTAQPGQMVARLVEQQGALAGLADMQRAAERQEAQLATELEQARAAVAEVASGAARGRTQAALDSAQQEAAAALARANAARLAHDMVAKVYVDVKGGLSHLAALLAPLPLPPGHIPVPVSDESLGDVVAQCGSRAAEARAFIATIPKALALLEDLIDNPELRFVPAA